MSRSATVRGITIDVADLERGAAFWGAILDVGVADRYDTYLWLSEIAPGIRLILQEVPERHSAKNRVHLDVHTHDPDGLVELVEQLGGSQVDYVDDPSYSLTVMADPDGNEFCLTRRLSPALSDTGRDGMMGS